MKVKHLRLFSIIMCLSLLIPLMLPKQMAVSAETKPYVSVNKSKASGGVKVSSKLKKQFDDQDQVTFLIKFKEQADTQKAAKEAQKLAKKQKISAFKTELNKRSAVVSLLRATADQTQSGVKEYLTKQKKEGNAKNIRSYFIVNAMAVTATKEVMEKVASFPEVDKVLPNEIRQIQPVKETDAKPIPTLDAAKAAKKSEKQKETKADTASVEWNIDRVGAPQVWAMGIDGAGTVVANIDTGVQWDHPALKEKYRGYIAADGSVNHEYNWFDATAGRAAPYDDDNHGTHTMGTMVGSKGNNQIGVAPGAKWIAVKAFTPAGGTDADLLEAGQWIIAPTDAQGNPHPEKAPDVVNNSWGGGPGLDDWYRQMVQNWRAAEIFPEFSAGNTTLTNPGGPGSVANPANYPESFATGATDINNKLASFSLRGPSPYGGIMKPEISAPGVNIRSSVPGGNYEGGWNGTSMAGPHVSAAVALLRQINASLSVADIEKILKETSVPLTDNDYPESPNNGYGHGLLNVFDAVSSIISGLGKVKGTVLKEGVDSEAPTYTHEAPQETYARMDLPLTITAKDNISISSVTLQYQDRDGNWQSIEADRSGGNYEEGTYTAILPGHAIAVPSLTYRWKIVDYGQHEVTTDSYNVNVLPGISVGYSADFESESVGWSSSGTLNTWEWGTPTSGPGNAASGTKVYATNLDGNYDNSANMALKMPPIDLGDGPAYLQFKHWYDIENNYDYAQVFVSTDQQNWTEKARFTNKSNAWINGQVDLSAYANQRIYVAFNLKTDGSVVKPGWYLDDVKLAAAPTTIKDTGKQKTEADVKASAKEKVDPSKIQPVNTLKIKKAEGKGLVAAPNGLPIPAVVSVLETGRSTTTNPANGIYSLTHAAGDYTLVAESYGYRSAQQNATIPADGEVVKNFVLEEIPKGTISGTVTNEQTGAPIKDATVYVVEDAAVQPVKTDENGNYSLTAYEGTYTLKVMAAGYYGEDTQVTVKGNETTDKDFALKPFITAPGGEIAYDDGTAENAHAFYDAGNGWAVKMSLPAGKDQAVVTGGKFRFWDTEWPVPGGNKAQVAVYDASGPEGAPGKKLAGPINFSAQRNGDWTTVDLSSYGIQVTGDFYMVYFQADPNPNAPGLGTDENGTNAGRSWQYVGGAWSPSPADEGNYMIRALVDYEVTAPVITSPADGSFTNQDTVKVEGQTVPGVNVHILKDGKKAAEATAGEDGKFAGDVTLSNGENVLTAKVVTDRGSTDESAPVKVTLDQKKPVLTIDSPANGLKTNKETVTVKGKVTEENLDSLKVNGKKVTVKDDGTYSYRMMLDLGENVIKVKATDKAGNAVTKKVTVYAQYEELVLENVKPDKNKSLKVGQSVKIEFDSSEDLDATFVIHMPLTNTKAATSNATELPMRETSPGHYEGYYTATSNVRATGATVEVRAQDDYGNTASEIAKGKLNIN
ncbi:S8 family serine peptidase [Fictibacillus enclensis]|uniref:S8 family serine peptidase n=1 Tax=Fictibacillus enclensis TaxID=1017270 RepID=UPI0025A03321|nr:S8 family serine peptidase [Fictibacillus enclensis]MDM5201442.1 S8 family serine peptidase [Fictibacillus enclensis]